MGIWYKVIEHGDWTKVEVEISGSEEVIRKGLEELCEAGISLPSPKERKEVSHDYFKRTYALELSETKMSKLRDIGTDEAFLGLRSYVGNRRRLISGTLFDTEPGYCDEEIPARDVCGVPRYLGRANGCIPPHLVPRSHIPPPSCGGG
jgi:hypothetical protein